MTQDVLEDFLKAFLTKAPPIGLVPMRESVHMIEDVTSILWYRHGAFQIQLFAVPQDYVIPEHKHPNVDSFEVMLGGEIAFSKNGKWVEEKDLHIPASPPIVGLSSMRGACIRVRPNDLHGGAFGPTGGVFMSVQHWLNDVKPHCVSLDYDGKTVGDKHLALVKFGEAVSDGGQKNLTWKDAASLEESAPTFLGNQ